jgi:hypothetical protein
MKKNILLLVTIALLTSCLPIATTASTQVYDLNQQWSTTANPNGTWSYRQAESLLINNPFPWVGTEYTSAYADCPACLIQFPLIVPVITKTTEPFKVPGTYGDLEVGDVFIAPGIEGNVRWTAPENGTIDVSGTIWSVDYSSRCSSERPIGTSWTLSHDGVFLSGGDISAAQCGGVYTKSSPYDLSLGSGGAAALQNIQVTAGEQVVLAFSGWAIGINFTITLTSDSLDPIAAVEALATTVIQMNLQNGIANSLDSKLDAALNVLLDVNVSNDGAACNSLQAFISSVEAQRGNKITSVQADQLIASAHQIEELLNCGN